MKQHFQPPQLTIVQLMCDHSHSSETDLSVFLFLQLVKNGLSDFTSVFIKEDSLYEYLNHPI